MGLKEYEEHMRLSDWSKVQWQDFFEREQWLFGYGLDYRMMRQFDREMTVGGWRLRQPEQACYRLPYEFHRLHGAC